MSTEINGLDGDVEKGQIAIVASRYNPGICDALVAAARETLSTAGFADSDILVIRVPGAWELPSVSQRIIEKPEVIAVIALGCVIKGETTHDEHINRAVSTALMQLSIDEGLPVGFGLLTCNTLEQAINRSGGTVGNKGHEAAEAVLEQLRLEAKLAKIIGA